MESLTRKPTRASIAVRGRDNARLRRAQLDAERALLDRAVEVAMNEYIQIQVEIAALREHHREAEQAQGRLIVRLRNLGRKDYWIAGVIGTTGTEVARLAKLVTATVERANTSA